MREIKFRAWHSDHGYSNSFGTGGHPEWVDGLTVSYFVQVCQFEQFTGLKDKNGKEIYEGDFIKSAEQVMLVTWSERHASFALGRPEWAFLHFFHEAVDAHRCEVVGNKRENPELLA
jgi:hypothetical protein